MDQTDAEAALREASVLRLTTTGRRTGAPRQADLWYVYENGLFLLLAATRGGRPAGWYHNLIARPDALVEAAGQSFRVRLEPPDRHDVTVDEILSLYRDKYGMQLVKVWFEGLPSLPVVLRPLGAV